MKHRWITFTLVLAALVALAGSALGEVMLIEYVDSSTYGNAGTRTRLSDGTTPTGNTFPMTLESVQLVQSLWNNATASIDDTNGVFYTRFRQRWRDGRNSIYAQGANVYIPVDGVDTNHWNVPWQNTTTNLGENYYNFGVDNAWITAGDGIPTNGIVANDGVGLEEINWAMIKPETVGWFPTNYAALAGSAEAIALGFLWNDLNTNGFLNNTDTIELKYGVIATNVDQATAFAEIDTPDELNAAVGNVTGPTNSPPAFDDDPFSAANALADAAYSDSIAGSATDIDGDPLTYSKVGGPAWLGIAGDGGLSGNPTSGDLGLNSFTVQVAATGGTDTATMTINVIEGLELVDFKSISTNGDWEVSIVGVPGDVSKLVEAADDVDFDTPEQDPVPLSAITVGSAYGDEVVHDAAGDATVQFNLGTNDATSAIRAEETGGTVTLVLAEYFDAQDGSARIQLSDGTNPVGSVELTNRDSNPQQSFWDSDIGGTRYSRWRPDFRAKGEIEAQGNGWYPDVTGTNLWQGPWVNTLTNSGDQVAMSSVDWNTPPATNNAPPINGFTPDDGVGQEEINWAMLKPESGNFGNAGAMALGILWTDNDTDGYLDATDTYTLKYVVGAIGIDPPHAFSGMDTKEELNAAVGNTP